MVEERARTAGVELVADPYVFTNAADGQHLRQMPPTATSPEPGAL